MVDIGGRSLVYPGIHIIIRSVRLLHCCSERSQNDRNGLLNAASWIDPSKTPERGLQKVQRSYMSRREIYSEDNGILEYQGPEIRPANYAVRSIVFPIRTAALTNMWYDPHLGTGLWNEMILVAHGNRFPRRRIFPLPSNSTAAEAARETSLQAYCPRRVLDAPLKPSPLCTHSEMEFCSHQ